MSESMQDNGSTIDTNETEQSEPDSHEDLPILRRCPENEERSLSYLLLK